MRVGGRRSRRSLVSVRPQLLPSLPFSFFSTSLKQRGLSFSTSGWTPHQQQDPLLLLPINPSPVDPPLLDELLPLPRQPSFPSLLLVRIFLPPYVPLISSRKLTFSLSLPLVLVCLHRSPPENTPHRLPRPPLAPLPPPFLRRLCSSVLSKPKSTRPSRTRYRNRRRTRCSHSGGQREGESGGGRRREDEGTTGSTADEEDQG